MQDDIAYLFGAHVLLYYCIFTNKKTTKKNKDKQKKDDIATNSHLSSLPRCTSYSIFSVDCFGYFNCTIPTAGGEVQEVSGSSPPPPSFYCEKQTHCYVGDDVYRESVTETSSCMGSASLPLSLPIALSTQMLIN